MYQILEKSNYSENVYRLVVKAPRIARSRKAGHFVIIRTHNNSERMPLTIADSDVQKGTITLVVQRVGVATARLCAMNVGDSIADVVGPLGRATEVKRWGTVVCAAGGVGAAPLLPIVEALKKAGNRVVVVLAARTRELVIMESEMKRWADDVMIMTDDGSYGTKGLVTEGVEKVAAREQVDCCFAIGPAIMMKYVCLLTKRLDIPTIVSLNTIMVDGTGMCGACRVSVGGETKFVCVDGPEFDGHQVDFDQMMKRMRAFSAEEKAEMARYEAQLTKTGCALPIAVGSEPDVNTVRIPQANYESEEREDGRDSAWRVELRKRMSAKERMTIPRVKMPELDAALRATQLREEVNRGLTPELAIGEAQRCLDCAKPGCVDGCPVGIDIPGFIKRLETGDTDGALQTIRKYSTLPAVCGRVCPQEKQCEAQCIHRKTGGEAVAIGHLERFAADYGHTTEGVRHQTDQNAEKIRIAVVGSGPAGLSFAGEMVNRNYDVTVFEALHEIGGVLKYGIPEYRLPNRIVDNEINELKHRGVRFEKDCVVGKTITVDELKHEGYRGLFVASGAGLPNFMNIPGENLINVLSSNEYLTRVNLMDAASNTSDTPVPRGKRVAVIGGGNTAMDSVRTALRLGAEEAIIIYRRSEAEMPARLEEVKHAKEEGVKFMTLHNPIEYHGDEDGHVNEVVLQRMKLGEPDASGRRSPVPIEGATETLPVDLVIVSVGVSPNPIVPRSVEGLELGRKNTIAVNETMQSSIPFIYAGGDIVRGGATVILAMGDGKRAAEEMDLAIKSGRL
jgi:glutamate synthase (NADPH/NADH) small chain